MAIMVPSVRAQIVGVVCGWWLPAGAFTMLASRLAAVTVTGSLSRGSGSKNPCHRLLRR